MSASQTHRHRYRHTQTHRHTDTRTHRHTQTYTNTGTGTEAPTFAADRRLLARGLSSLSTAALVVVLLSSEEAGSTAVSGLLLFAALVGLAFGFFTPSSLSVLAVMVTGFAPEIGFRSSGVAVCVSVGATQGSQKKKKHVHCVLCCVRTQNGTGQAGEQNMQNVQTCCLRCSALRCRSSLCKRRRRRAAKSSFRAASTFGARRWRQCKSSA